MKLEGSMFVLKCMAER